MTQRNLRTPYPAKKGGLPARDSIIQVCEVIRERVTQSLIDCILTCQSTALAIYSRHSAQRKTRPAANSCGGKSGHPVQPRLCHSQSRRSLSWENQSSHHARLQSTVAEYIRGEPHTVLQSYMAPVTCRLRDTICLA